MQILRFAIVGAAGTALHYVVLVLLVTGLDRDPAVGAVLGATCGAAFNYWLNHRFTFRSDRSHAQAVPRFISMAAAGIVLNGMIVKALTLAGVHYLLSQAIATPIILVLNFFLSKLWIFRRIQ